MEMKLYSTVDNENIINKTLTLIYTIQIKMKTAVDVSNPVIILNDKGTMDFSTCNYVYLEHFNRFYFIRSLRNQSTHNWSLELECDVLESFKEDILRSVGEVEKTLGDGDYQDVRTDFQVIKEVDIHNSDIELEPFSTLVLSTIGG